MRLSDAEPGRLIAELTRLDRTDPARVDELTWQWLDELGKAGDVTTLEAIFLMGAPLVQRAGLTQARYLASPYGRFVDSLLRWGLTRWWQGHRFYDEGRRGISNTPRQFRWVWRLLFPGYPRPSGCRGEEVFDFRAVTVADAKRPEHRVTLLDWHLPMRQDEPLDYRTRASRDPMVRVGSDQERIGRSRGRTGHPGQDSGTDSLHAPLAYHDFLYAPMVDR